ncbi:MAG: Eco57I restriction-modification methylase domain-containing protein, partial [candidate division WOR-3 bacterium]
MIRGYLLSDYIIDEIKKKDISLHQKSKSFFDIVNDIKSNNFSEADIREKVVEMLKILGYNEFIREYSISNLMRIDIIADNKIVVECKRKGVEFDKKEISGKSPAKQIRNYLFDEEVKKFTNFGILTDGIKFRIYYANKLSEYVEFDFEEINEDEFKVFYYLLNERDFPDNFLNALNENYYYQTRVSDELLKNVFERIIPLLASQFYKNETNLEKLKRYVLIFLFRLLFIFYAEDRNLIDLRAYSLKDIRRRINEFKSDKTCEIFQRIKTIFKLINEGDKELNLPRYNGGLFKDNEFYNSLEISDKIMSEIIYKLSYFENKLINYKDISVRHLGSIYETILDFDLKFSNYFYLEKGNERKVGGVYYTPEFVVNFIIEKTIGRKVEEILSDFKKKFDEIEKMNKSDLLKKFKELGLDPKKKEEDGYKDKTEREMKRELKNYYDPIRRILNLKILDLASGSGHFLVSAIDYLSNKIEEIEYILEKDYNFKSSFFDELEEIRNEIVEYSKMFNFNLKKEQIYDENLIKRVILKRCIYGVDINELAVELTKISLWLFSFTIGAPLSFLDHHIKSGNSIIGTGINVSSDLLSSNLLEQAKRMFNEINGFYDITDIEKSYEIYSHFEEFISEKRKNLNYNLGYKEDLKPFHFILEFPDAVDGFDVIISNPPYVRQERIKEFKSYLKKDFDNVFLSTADIYVYFYHRALNLLKDGGYLGFITSNKFFRAKYGEKLRDFLSKFKILDVIDFGGYRVFKSATVDTAILIIKKERNLFDNKVNALSVSDNSIVFED